MPKQPGINEETTWGPLPLNYFPNCERAMNNYGQYYLIKSKLCYVKFDVHNVGNIIQTQENIFIPRSAVIQHFVIIWCMILYGCSTLTKVNHT